MMLFGRLLAAEWLKLRKSAIWLLLAASPALAAAIGYLSIRSEGPDGQSWVYLSTVAAISHGIVFLPLLAGLFSAFVCRYEHDSGGWKQLLALPVQRGGVYLAKLAIVLLLLFLCQLLYLAGLAAAGLLLGLPGPMPLADLAQSALGGFAAAVPLAAMQLAFSVGWTSFAAPLAINTMMALPNVIIINSARYAPYYPWAQPIRAMMPDTENRYGILHLPPVSLYAVVVLGFVLFLLGGLIYFRRKDV